MFFSAFLSRRRIRACVHDLYQKIMAQSRQPAFYRDMGIMDSPEGRFEMLALHAFVVLRRLKSSGMDPDIGQALFDLMFADMDRNLREMGIPDLRVGPRVKGMAKEFYGRVGAYETGLAEGATDGLLVDAIKRNLYSAEDGAEATNVPPRGAPEALAAYLRANVAHLSGVGDGKIMAGDFCFSDLPSDAITASIQE
ncbi:MAG: ubiquinol-cytochrome C chaperone family protein [Alphaproteobacteria bacterium]|jgi:cytochrome b pre-mRNA-processing protein 3